MSGSSPAPVAPPCRPPEPAGQKQRWRIGTISYTTGGLVLLFFWLLWGDFAWSMKERSIPAVLQLLLKRFDASDLLTGLLIGSLPGVLVLILGPVISCKSDRHRGRWGRRIPYLLAPTPVAVLAMVGLAFCPVLGKQLHAWLGEHSPGVGGSTLILFGVFWTLFEFASITANAVFGGLINDVVPTPVLGRFYGLFRALSLGAGMIFNYWILGKAEQHFMEIFIGLAVLYGAGFTMMCFKVKEGRYEPPPAVAPGVAGGFVKAMRGYVKDCFGQSYYRWYFVAMALMWMAAIPPTLFGVYFAKSIQMDMTVYGKCYALMYLISLALAWPLGLLADRFHPLRVGLGATMLFMLVTLWGGFFARDAWSFGLAIVAQGVCAGTWMTSTASLNQRLLPRARFAQFASAAGIVTGLGTISISPGVGLLLDKSGHDYRLIFLASAVLAFGSLAAGCVVHRRFMRLGGPLHYQAPGEAGESVVS